MSESYKGHEIITKYDKSLEIITLYIDGKLYTSGPVFNNPGEATDYARGIIDKMSTTSIINEDMAKQVEEAIRKSFPQSYLHITTKGPLGSHDVYVRFAVGKGKEEWLNGIIQNDPLFMIFVISGWDTGYNQYIDDAKSVKARLLQGGEGKFPSNKMSPETLVKKIEAYFAELKKVHEATNNTAESAKYGDVKGQEPGEKDLDRMRDLEVKAKGNEAKMLKLAQNMANTLGVSPDSVDKAIRRAKAAEKVYPGALGKKISKIFMDALESQKVDETAAGFSDLYPDDKPKEDPSKPNQRVKDAAKQLRAMIENEVPGYDFTIYWSPLSKNVLSVGTGDHRDMEPEQLKQCQHLEKFIRSKSGRFFVGTFFVEYCIRSSGNVTVVGAKRTVHFMNSKMTQKACFTNVNNPELTDDVSKVTCSQCCHNIVLRGGREWGVSDKDLKKCKLIRFTKADAGVIKIPKKKNLGVPRRNMPQIKRKHMDKFVDWLEDEGVAVKEVQIPLKALKPTQKEFNTQKVHLMMNEDKHKLSKSLLVSKDNYILDGHHKWLAQLNIDETKNANCIQVDLNAKEFLDKAKEFSKVRYRDLNDNEYKDTDPNLSYAEYGDQNMDFTCASLDLVGLRIINKGTYTENDQDKDLVYKAILETSKGKEKTTYKKVLEYLEKDPETKGVFDMNYLDTEVDELAKLNVVEILDEEEDMYCEGCGSFFFSSFQDNEAYCPKCGGTEISPTDEAESGVVTSSANILSVINPDEKFEVPGAQEKVLDVDGIQYKVFYNGDEPTALDVKTFLTMEGYLYEGDSKLSVASNGIKCKLQHYGKVYDCLLFKTDKEANDFMESNSDYGVIKVEENKGVYVAKNSDKGTKASYEGEPDQITALKAAGFYFDNDEEGMVVYSKDAGEGKAYFIAFVRGEPDCVAGIEDKEGNVLVKNDYNTLQEAVNNVEAKTAASYDYKAAIANLLKDTHTVTFAAAPGFINLKVSIPLAQEDEEDEDYYPDEYMAKDILKEALKDAVGAVESEQVGIEFVMTSERDEANVDYVFLLKCPADLGKELMESLSDFIDGDVTSAAKKPAKKENKKPAKEATLSDVESLAKSLMSDIEGDLEETGESASPSAIAEEAVLSACQQLKFKISPTDKKKIMKAIATADGSPKSHAGSDDEWSKDVSAFKKQYPNVDLKSAKKHSADEDLELLMSSQGYKTQKVPEGVKIITPYGTYYFSKHSGECTKIEM